MEGRRGRGACYYCSGAQEECQGGVQGSFETRQVGIIMAGRSGDPYLGTVGQREGGVRQRAGGIDLGLRLGDEVFG